ncbi:MAG TPA: response regulator [Anaerolineae bacterium]|nr:response regulator [Anaerolineae bacterium]
MAQTTVAQTKRIKDWFDKIGSIGDQEGDTQQARMEHKLLVYMGLFMGGGGILWGTICFFYGLYVPAIIPYGYTVLTVVNFAGLYWFKNFQVSRFFQVLMSLLLPFMFQWSLGGFVSSGAVMLWSMLALVGSLTFQDIKLSQRWLIVYLLLTIFSGFIDDWVKRYALNLSEGVTTAFFVTNITVISAIVFGLSIYLLSLLRHHQFQLEYLVEARTADLVQATEQAQKERQLAEDANRAKSTFLAAMSHEIRTPMNGVIGMVHLALDTKLTNQQQGYLNNILISATALLGVINDILDFTKIEAGKLRMEEVPFKLEQVMHDVSTILAPKIQEKGLELLFRVEDVPQYLIGDPLRLRQILLNLLNNGIKFTEMGEILVSLKVVEKQDERIKLQFAVRDSGIGMSAAQAKRLFQPFVQADDSITRKYGGTGLGLSISKRLTELMGGAIWVESTLGEGSVFTFEAWFGYDGETKEVLTPRRLDWGGLRALVVDDNGTAREILSSMLDKFGIESRAVVSAAEALAELEKKQETNPYQIVLADWQMPEMDGAQLVAQIRQRQNWVQPNVLMVTAYDSQELYDITKPLQVDHYLTKPVSPSTLLDSLTNVLGPGKNSLVKAPTASIRQVRYNFEKVHILLVEDNEINQQIARSLLIKVGAEVTIANNGQEAVDMVCGYDDELPYDGILMDVQMPFLDGYQATKMIRDDGRFNELPIIGLTAHALIEERQKGLESGMNEQITKPIEPELLYATLKQWLGAKVKSETRLKAAARIEAESETEQLVREPEQGGGAPVDEWALAGFDARSSIKRLAGNEGLYRTLLQRFAEGYGDVVVGLSEAMERDEREVAIRQAHTLKGVASSIGALDLAEVAGRLEKVLKEGDFEAGRRLLPTAAATLAQAIGTVNRFLADKERGETVEVEGSGESEAGGVAEMLVTLYGYLVDDDGEAIDYLAEVWDSLRHELPEERLLALQTSVNDFDFEQGVIDLEIVAEAIGVSLEKRDE